MGPANNNNIKIFFIAIVFNSLKDRNLNVKKIQITRASVVRFYPLEYQGILPAWTGYPNTSKIGPKSKAGQELDPARENGD